ncbi:neural cell adhesion molecule 1 isoform X2 [Euwallacea fornicatus]|uniref:neural cell adhesion molecule 1 isoform X2 n=1 Tax=Euwallacea fornicatus TaxID=995702 RepID=UPI00338D9AF5
MGLTCLRDVLLMLWVIVELEIGEVNMLDSKEFQKSLPAKMVWAVAGRDANLPCDVTPALPGDNVTMIFWFKDSLGMPLYSLDARGGSLSKASHLAMSDDLGRRVYFVADEETSRAHLRIQNVIESDQGVFRCRVDFVNSPTRNFQVNLSLIEQPSKPQIFDAEGKEIRLNSSAGPFLEGEELFLSCQVKGGHPKPTLIWWFNNTILDGVVDSDRNLQPTVNQLLIPSVSRSLKGSKLECRATSSEEAGIIVREVPLTIFLKPRKVKIVSPNNLLSTGKSHDIKCETSGSYPPAKLTWLLDDKPIRNAVVTEEETTSFTGSILTLTVSAEDDGKILVCQADNPRFPRGSAQDSRGISVAYPPRVSVALDSGLVTPVRDGTDVILYCKTFSRPEAHSYYWYHDSHLVAYNESGGVLPSQDTLTMKNINQNSAGQYACSARNSEGETYSAPLDLPVMYSPRCKKGLEAVRLGIVPYESITAQCIIDAVPPVNRFFWTYNNSKGVFPLQGAQTENKGNVSIVHIPEEQSEEIHFLQCWAENDVGKQEIPCSFHVIPAEPPDPPKGCLMRNTSQGALEVSCIAGSDGGLQQSFVLEVSDLTPAAPPGIQRYPNDQGEADSPAFRVLGERPVFKLINLKPNREYQAVVYAENARGRSVPPIVLPLIQISSEEQLLEDDTQNYDFTNIPTSSNPNLTVIIAGVSVAAFLLIIGVVVTASVVACRRSAVRRRERRSSKPPSELELSEAGFGEGFHRRSALYRASMYGECEERISRLIEGPDLILAPASFSPQNSDY